jgi:lipopolysaccharide export system protein LptA
MSLSFLSFRGNFDQFGNEINAPVVGVVQTEVDESFFKGVNYYSVKDLLPFLEIESSELSISSNNKVVIAFNPQGVIYRYDKKQVALDSIKFKSINSRALLATKDIFLDKEVEIEMADTKLLADKIDILSNGDILHAVNNVKTLTTDIATNDQILVNSNNTIYKPKEQFFEYQGNVTGIIKRKRVYEESINFKTDLLTLNAPLHLVIMKGNVYLKKDNLDAYANRGEIFLENYNKKLKYYVLYDDVRLKEVLADPKNIKKPLIRKAFSEKLEGLISDSKIILTGFPKVFQEQDIIKGNRIIIRENIETVEVDDANTNIILDKKVKE